MFLWTGNPEWETASEEFVPKECLRASRTRRYNGMRKGGAEMSVPAEVARQVKERFLQRVARLRATPEERARILAAGTPFDYDAWLQEAGPAVPEELVEMEEILREREEERWRSIAGGAAILRAHDHG